MTELKKEAAQTFISLEEILGRDDAALSTLTQGTFDTQALGTVPFTSVDYAEYKDMKKACMKMVPNGTGGMQPDLDDDKLMVLLIIEAVHKDQRSTFTFRDKRLHDKLGTLTDVAAASKLLKPGEIVKFALEIQNASGFGQKAQKAMSDAVKNS